MSVESPQQPGRARPSGQACETCTVTDAPVSAALFDRAQRVIPGGVNSPVRAFRAVGGTPRFMVSGRGAYLTDADGREYVDLVASWGPMILGHAHPAVVEAARAAALRGLSFGTPTEGEVELAEEIVARVAPGRAGAARQLRHRGDDERDPAGPRRHRPAPGREVRRLLPRARRRAARRGRLGRGHVRAARHPGRDGCADRRDDRAALQRPGRRRGRIRRARRRHRVRDHRGGRRKHGRGRAAARVQCGAARRSRPSTAPC